MLETLALVGSQHLADLVAKTLLLTIELLAHVMLQAFDPIAAGAQDATNFLALRGVEVEIRGQPT